MLEIGLVICPKASIGILHPPEIEGNTPNDFHPQILREPSALKNSGQINTCHCNRRFHVANAEANPVAK